MKKRAFHPIKNFGYAIEGLKDVWQNEVAFKIELIIFCIATMALFFLDNTILEKVLMFCMISFVLIAEVTNSAVERTVDLVTLEQHPMAKKAKDIASAIVLLSIILCVIVWFVLVVI